MQKLVFNIKPKKLLPERFSFVLNFGFNLNFFQKKTNKGMFRKLLYKTLSRQMNKNQSS